MTQGNNLPLKNQLLLSPLDNHHPLKIPSARIPDSETLLAKTVMVMVMVTTRLNITRVPPPQVWMAHNRNILQRKNNLSFRWNRSPKFITTENAANNNCCHSPGIGKNLNFSYIEK